MDLGVLNIEQSHNVVSFFLGGGASLYFKTVDISAVCRKFIDAGQRHLL